MDHLQTNTNLFKAQDIAVALKEAEERKQAEGAIITPEAAETSLAVLFKRMFRTSSSLRVLLALMGGSLVNTLVLGVVDVIAVSGFIGDVGTDKLPWLWTGELLLSLVISGVMLQIIDSLPRVKMMKILMAGLLVTYALLAGLFLLNVSTSILYPLMYLIYAQQAILFPMAFWNLANNIYSLAEARKLFPLLSSGELLGRLIGYSIFTLTGLLGHSQISQNIIQNPSLIMGISALLFLFGLITLPRVEEQTQKIKKKTSFVANLKSGFETIREVPFFRNMSALVAFTWVALTILLFNFYASLDEASAQGLQFQTTYSIYNIAVLFLPLLFQWTFVDELLERISPKIGYLFLPFTLLVSLALAFLLPNIFGGISALFIAMIIYRGWYMPLYQSLYKLVPQERRGRVRSLLGNTSYTVGSLIGALLVGATMLLLPLWDVNPALTRTVYLVAALGATAAAIYVAFRIRATYDDSMFSWRVARRTRTVNGLDRLDDL